MSFQVKMKGLNKAKKNIDNFFKKKTRELSRVVTLNSLEIQKNARKKVPKDTGRLASSIEVKYINNRLIARVFSGSKIAPFVEFGTRPHYPPPRALRGWALRHGFSPGAEYAIANKIAQHGTRPQPFLFPAFFKQRKRFIKGVIEVVRKK